MLFDLQEDLGFKIAFYVVPDGGGTTPTVKIRANGAELLEISANETLATLIQAGRHATGHCGFVIDGSLIPGLETYQDLEIVDAESNFLIYRRVPPDRVSNVRVCRLETHLLPLWSLDDALNSRFSYWHKGIDRYGLETSTQVFCLRNVQSSYASGRLFFKTYEFYLSRGIKTIAMLRDPFDELAERLIVLKAIGGRAEDLLGARDAMTYSIVSESLEGFDETDERSSKRFFRKASSDVLTTLSNPLVRQLTTSAPSERPNQTSIATALDALASFELIGLRSDGAEFRRGLAYLTSIPEGELPLLSEYSRVTNLGTFLRSNTTAESILEKDLEVYHHIKNALVAEEV